MKIIIIDNYRAHLNTQGIEYTNVKEAILLFQKSQQPSDKLKAIWLITLQNYENKQYTSEFFTMMRWIAYQHLNYCLKIFKFVYQFQMDSHFLNKLLDLMQQNNQILNLLKCPCLNHIEQLQFLINNITSPHQFKLLNRIFQINLIQVMISMKNTAYIINNKIEKQQGYIEGEIAKAIFYTPELSGQILKQLWALVDTNLKGFLFKNEYIVALHLISCCRKNIPQVLPDSLQRLIDQNKLHNLLQLKIQKYNMTLHKSFNLKIKEFNKNQNYQLKYRDFKLKLNLKFKTSSLIVLINKQFIITLLSLNLYSLIITVTK
ncbi:unnamed protein product [Paramecium sonneborni]|uniref:EF-hand domain-containing protein n=1 Tax=Paramecium sonneborni TaxID=65129 RepID=A0A8S1ND51_9CILI|nr:unnamed protein product [Paramecium sonneborni]